MLKKNQLQWIILNILACRRCGNKNHSNKECKQEPVFRQRILTEIRYKNLARLYKRKQVLISVLAKFGEISWANVVKRFTIQPKTEQSRKQAIPNHNDKMNQRLSTIKRSIFRILEHLNLKLEKKTKEPDNK